MQTQNIVVFQNICEFCQKIQIFNTLSHDRIGSEP